MLRLGRQELAGTGTHSPHSVLPAPSDPAEGAGHSYRNDNPTPLAMVRHPAKDKRSSVSQYSIEGAFETKQSAYCWIPGPSSPCREEPSQA